MANRTCTMFRSLLRSSILCLSASLAIATTTAQAAAPVKQNTHVLDVWIGTARSQTSKGIYHSQLDLRTGKLRGTTLAAAIDGPGFLALHPNGYTLYAVASKDAQPVVAAYEIVSNGHPAPSLRLRNAVAIDHGGAAHVAIDSTGKTLLTAQYGKGSVAVFAVNGDGSIRARTQLHQHDGGAKVVAGRQNQSHPHYCGFSPDERFAFVPDLGTDQVVIYRTDLAAAQLTMHGFASVPPGGGPRHMKFHPNGKWIYVLNELDLSVTTFDYDAAAGKMQAKQTIETVPKDLLQKEQFSSCSEICVHRTGKFVYAANRGHDTITAFRVANDTGTLSLIERESMRGATPRNFALTPEGEWLLAAGQDSNTLASFAIDEQTGELTYNRSIVNVPTPICIVFSQQ